VRAERDFRPFFFASDARPSAASNQSSNNEKFVPGDKGGADADVFALDDDPVAEAQGLTG
jgi:hypothetical protein